MMGRVTAPFGVHGWVRIHTLTARAGSLRDYPVWWLARDGTDGWRETPVAAAKVQGRGLVARFAGMDDRDAAAAFRGCNIAVPRTALPAPAPDEFYWADLIGLRVENRNGCGFGRVTEVMQTGANDVLVVVGTESKETLIPFIANVIRSVDPATGPLDVNQTPVRP